MAPHLDELSEEAFLGELALKLAFTLVSASSSRGGLGLVCELGQESALQVQVIDLVQRCAVGERLSLGLELGLAAIHLVGYVRSMLDQVLLSLEDGAVFNSKELKDGFF